MTGEPLEHPLKLLALARVQRREQVALGGNGRLLGEGEPLPACRSQLHEVAAPVCRVARAQDQAVGLEGVEQPDQIAGVDAQGGAKTLLGQRPGVLEVVQDGELVVAHVERRERLREPVAGDPGEPEDQDAPCRRAGGLAACPGGSGGRRCSHQSRF